MSKPQTPPSKGGQKRRDDTLTPGPYEDNYSPEQRLAQHQASLAVPETGFSVRMQLRGKLGDERSLVRRLYDLANNQPKRRRRRRKKGT